MKHFFPLQLLHLEDTTKIDGRAYSLLLLQATSTDAQNSYYKANTCTPCSKVLIQIFFLKIKFETHVHRDWKLTLEWKSGVTFSLNVMHEGPGLTRKIVIDRKYCPPKW